MTEFAIRDIDLTRIESRPTRKELGTYIFFLDCVGHIEDDAVAEALKALHRSLCRCALSGVMADGIGRGSGAAATRRGDRLAEPAAGRQPMSGRLVLVRHGQSLSNVERRLDTRPPGRELTDLGREQARTFARELAARDRDGRAFRRGARLADRRRDRRRTEPGPARTRRHSRGSGRRAGGPQRRRGRRGVQRRLPAMARGRAGPADARRRIGDAGARPVRAGDHATADALSRRRRVAQATSSSSATARRSGWWPPRWRASTEASPSTITCPTPNPLC